MPATATPVTPSWTWNPANYPVVTEHGSPAALAAWMATHGGAVSWAHRVSGNTTIGNDLTISGDTVIYVQGGSLTVTGRITTTASTPVKLLVVADGAVTYAGQVDSAGRLRVGSLAAGDVSFGASAQLRVWVYSVTGGVALAADADLTYVPVRDPGLS